MRIPKIIAFKVTFFEKLVFPFHRSLTYKYTDAYNILRYQYLNFSKYLRNPYIYHVYFVYNVSCLYSFIYIFLSL